MEGNDAMDKDGYRVLPIMEETGYVVVDSYDQHSDPREWEDLVYVDWKSSGDTRFAPLASAYGDMECKSGDSQVVREPTLPLHEKYVSVSHAAEHPSCEAMFPSSHRTTVCYDGLL